MALAPNPPEKVENVNLNSPVARLLSRLNNEAKTSPVKQAKHTHVQIYTAWGICIEGREKGGGLLLAYPLKPLPAPYSYERGHVLRISAAINNF